MLFNSYRYQDWISPSVSGDFFDSFKIQMFNFPTCSFAPSFSLYFCLFVCFILERANLQSEMLPFTYLYQFSLYLIECYLSSVSVSLLSQMIFLVSSINGVMATGNMDILFVVMWNWTENGIFENMKYRYIKMDMNMWKWTDWKDSTALSACKKWCLTPPAFLLFTAAWPWQWQWGLVFSAYTQNLTGIFLPQLKAWVPTICLFLPVRAWPL